jgi:hypothetical protein
VLGSSGLYSPCDLGSRLKQLLGEVGYSILIFPAASNTLELRICGNLRMRLIWAIEDALERVTYKVDPVSCKIDDSWIEQLCDSTPLPFKVRQLMRIHNQLEELKRTLRGLVDIAAGAPHYARVVFPFRRPNIGLDLLEPLSEVVTRRYVHWR